MISSVVYTQVEDPLVSSPEPRFVGHYELSPKFVRLLMKTLSGRRSAHFVFMGLILFLSIHMVTGIFATGEARSGTGLAQLLFLSVLCGLMVPFAIRWAACRRIRELQPAQKRVTLSLYDEVLCATDGVGNRSDTRWDAFQQVWETQEALFVQLQNGSQILLPREAFTKSGEFEDVRRFVLQHVRTSRRATSRHFVWLILALVFLAFWIFWGYSLPNAPTP